MPPTATLEAAKPAPVKFKREAKNSRHGKASQKAMTMPAITPAPVVSVPVTFTPDVLAELREKAAACNISVPELVRITVENDLDESRHRYDPKEEEYLARLAEEAEGTCKEYVSSEEFWKGLCPTP
jgi:hypothetical protein